MRFRYVIEHAPKSAPEPFVVSQLEPDDDSGQVVLYATDADDAKRQVALLEPEARITWKPAPKAWQPDALFVSSWLDDGVTENRDA